MPTLTGKSLGFRVCDFVARGETIHEVLEQMIGHIEADHLEEWGQKEKNLDLEEEKDFLLRHVEDEDSSPI